MTQVLGEARRNIPEHFFETKGGRHFYAYLLKERLERHFFYEVTSWPREEIIQWIRCLGSAVDQEELCLYFSSFNRSDSAVLMKNTYADSYGFTERTQAGLWPAISSLLDKIPMQLVRSRIVEMKSHEVEPEALEYYWHRDDYPFLEYRLLICLRATHSGFGIEFEDNSKYYMETGDVLFWDTSKPHRAFCDRFDEGSRVCLVLGFSPWLDYFPQKKIWRINGKFNKIHPNDCLLDLVTNGILEYGGNN